jgi:hypothetical protein
MNTGSNTRLRLTTQVGQAHAATGVLLDLGTNSQPHRPKNPAEHKTRALLTYTSQAGEHHRSDRSLLVKPDYFHITVYTGQADVAHRSDWSQPESPKTPNRPTELQTRNNSKTGRQRTHPNVHPSKTQQGSAPVRPVRGTGQTGLELLQVRLRFFGLGFVDQPRNPVVFW